MVRRADLALTSPVPAARQTAVELGLTADVEPALRDLNYGRWAGQTLDQVAAAEPDAVAVWLSDPAAAPHGGECLLTFLHHVAEWLEVLEGPERVIAVTHPAVLRGVVLAVLQAPPPAFWRVEVGPLARVRLRGERNRRSLIECG